MEVEMLPLVLSLRRGEVREVCCVVASIILTVGRGEATIGEKVLHFTFFLDYPSVRLHSTLCID